MSDPAQVSEAVADHFYSVSATSSYCSLFQAAKVEKERISLPNIPGDETGINKDLTMQELMWALDCCRDGSEGPDDVGYPMLQRMPIYAKMHFLEILNEIWNSGEIPVAWKEGIIIPIPKCGKDPNKLEN